MAKIEQLTGGRSIWRTLKKELEKAPAEVVVLPVLDQVQADGNLLAIQISTQSDFGAILHYTGGLLIDSGWVRVLGSGGGVLRGFLDWNEGKTVRDGKVASGSVLVADDVLGGIFALNGGGALGEDIGKIYYLAPDTFEWESLGLGYADFIGFLISGKLAEYYAPYRFEGWQEAIKELTPNEIWLFDEDIGNIVIKRDIVSIEQWFTDILAGKEQG